MQRGEVWWVRFGPAVGGEIQKERPAVVIRPMSSSMVNLVRQWLTRSPLLASCG
jgi:mRNA-degrading endonuclease toxin of MazEF toxin-antitoxin module